MFTIYLNGCQYGEFQSAEQAIEALENGGWHRISPRYQVYGLCKNGQVLNARVEKRLQWRSFSYLPCSPVVSDLLEFKTGT